MANLRRIRLPLSPEEARDLRLGELVLAEGEAVITAGLPTHQRVIQFLDSGATLPIDLTAQAFFHMGMCAAEEGDKLVPLYVNPTTSTRFAAQLPRMIRALSLTTVAGKGGVDAECVSAMHEQGCVYLSMVGGASALLSAAITEVVETGWNDLIAQFRLSRIRFKNLGPLTVAVDAHGASLYARIVEEAERKRPAILAELSARRSGH